MPFEQPFLGTGWSFPPTFSGDPGEVETTSGLEDIERSLEILLSTTLGERLMNPTYGCALDDMMFETLNTSRVTYLKNLIETAILYHEARIDARDVTVEPDQLEGVLRIGVEFTVRGSNSRFNFVYPFYLDQAEG